LAGLGSSSLHPLPRSARLDKILGAEALRGDRNGHLGIARPAQHAAGPLVEGPPRVAEVRGRCVDACPDESADLFIGIAGPLESWKRWSAASFVVIGSVAAAARTSTIGK